MLRGMKFTGQEDKDSNMDGINHCPVCGVNGKIGAFCETHSRLIKSYDWIKNYINNLEKFDNKTVHILECAISDRVSYVINDIEVVDGRLAIEEYLQKNLYERIEEDKKIKCGFWMEKTLKEILALQRARNSVMKIIKEKQ